MKEPPTREVFLWRNSCRDTSAVHPILLHLSPEKWRSPQRRLHLDGLRGWNVPGGGDACAQLALCFLSLESLQGHPSSFLRSSGAWGFPVSYRRKEYYSENGEQSKKGFWTKGNSSKGSMFQNRNNKAGEPRAHGKSLNVREVRRYEEFSVAAHLQLTQRHGYLRIWDCFHSCPNLCLC